MNPTRRVRGAVRLAAAVLVACAVAPAAAQAQVAPPTATAFFLQDAATPGGPAGAGFSVANPNAGVTLTGVSVSMTLPAGLVIATPSALSTTCDGTVTAPDGGTSITLSGASLGPAGEELPNSCSVVFGVVASGPGIVTIATGAPSSNETGAGSPSAGASMQVLAPPTLAQSFDDTSIVVGETARVTFTMTNPNASARLYNLAFDDTLPAGLVVATPANAASTCAVDGLLADAGATTISLLGLVVEANSQCSVSVDVTGTAATVSPNQTGPLSYSYDAGGGLRSATAPGASDTLVVVAPPALSAAFGAASIAPGATTSLTFTLANSNPALALTGVGFTATLSPGLVVASPSALSGSCGAGTIIATAGAGSISLSAATLPAGAGCTFTVNVRGIGLGAQTVTAGGASSTEAGAGAPASASLLVASPPVGVPPGLLPPPVGAPRLPSNAFRVTKVRSARDGTVRFDVTVAGRGDVNVLETLGTSSERIRVPGPNRFTIARKLLRPSKAGTLHVKLTPNARGKRAIRRARRTLRANLWVSFRPTGGRAGNAVRKTVLFRRP